MSLAVQISRYLFEETETCPDLALPDHEDLPSQLAKPRPMLGVARRIPFQLRQPVCSIGFGPTDDSAARVVMLMPETAMHENHLPSRREDEVRLARQVSTVQPVPVAHRMQEAPHGHFGLHSLGPDARHDLASTLWIYGVDHLAAATGATPTTHRPPLESIAPMIRFRRPFEIILLARMQDMIRFSKAGGSISCY